MLLTSKRFGFSQFSLGFEEIWHQMPCELVHLMKRDLWEFLVLSLGFQLNIIVFIFFCYSSKLNSCYEYQASCIEAEIILHCDW